MPMGRRRQHRRDLPERGYFRHNAYYFVARNGEWIWLARDRAIALKKYADINASPIAGGMAAIIERHMREVTPTKAPRTQQNNAREIIPLKRVFGHMEPGEITSQDIYAYMDMRPRIAANREVALLSRIFRYAIRWGLATDNPCRQVTRNPERPRRRHIEDHEFAAVYETATPVIRCAMDIARLTGLRLGDILRLNEREHIRDEGVYIETGKTGKRLLIEWTDNLRDAIARARSLRGSVRSIYLIANQEGQSYTVSGFESLWQRIMAKAISSGKLAERFHFHDLRAFAAHRAENPSELLGHDDPRTTSRIYRRGPRRVKPAR